MKKVLAIFMVLLLWGCSAVDKDEAVSVSQSKKDSKPQKSMQLQFASGFSVDYYEDGYKLITLADKSRFLVVPEGKDVPAALPEGITALQQPIKDIYLTATSAMGLFDAIDRLDAVRLSGTRADGWYIENAKAAMERGDIVYAGKYSEPDYELILDEGCGLAIESTMIAKASQVKEKLEEIGVTVLIDQSSYESHPLGRAEWIKLYAALLNEEQKAEALFEQQVKYMDDAVNSGKTGKTAAFFHINSSGQVVVRSSSDYISKMIELAGGDYIFDGMDDNGGMKATNTIEMESFFAAAQNADYLIYNGTIADEMESIQQLVSLNEMLADFKAVQNGNVWCTEQGMFQETMQHGRMISDFNTIFTEEAPAPEQIKYMYRLK